MQCGSSLAGGTTLLRRYHHASKNPQRMFVGKDGSAHPRIAVAAALREVVAALADAQEQRVEHGQRAAATLSSTEHDALALAPPPVCPTCGTVWSARASMEEALDAAHRHAGRRDCRPRPVSGPARSSRALPRTSVPCRRHASLQSFRRHLLRRRPRRRGERSAARGGRGRGDGAARLSPPSSACCPLPMMAPRAARPAASLHRPHPRKLRRRPGGCD